MGSIYLTEAATWFRNAGLTVVEYDGWKTRARSSGGYSTYPLCVMWHHTASTSSPESDAYYECYVADAKPIANVNIARDGVVWLLAAGATNTNGSGNTKSFSRGTVPADSMNSYAFGMEIANNGVGETYPQVQIDAAFIVSNTMNARCGNRPDDVMTHADYAPSRKIDPAGPTAGSWHPSFINSNKTWKLQDVRDECKRRAGSTPPKPPDPTPPTTGEIDMYLLGVKSSEGGVATLRVGVGVLCWEANGDALGIDKWFGLPYKECGDSDASSLFVSRTATGPVPSALATPGSGFYCPATAAAWRQ